MNEQKAHKIVLIGAGAVGTSFLYAAINRSIASHYEIIDVSQDIAKGNALDLEDAIATNNSSFSVELGSYKKCKDADVIVITAGKPQKSEQNRLDLMKSNVKIMKDIAINIKKSGFNGITIIASNPVDVLTAVYQKVTDFDKNKVIGSGTLLDSARLRFEIGKRINISARSIDAYVIGEHGDSSVSVFSSAAVKGIPLATFAKKFKFTEQEMQKIHETVYKKAYEIIKLKRATFYGIGSALADLSYSVLNNSLEIKAVSAYLNGEYGKSGIYAGMPAIIGENGIIKVIEAKLSSNEKDRFAKSANLIKKSLKEVLKEIGYES
ncbi:MAG: L-lactate dehydrogenase [Endozoicomonas sp. (ex Botrylloides leachii)]|nr:L-lactate dehydrogenase [Endozoicomonas sp. (ex Botrylloides leachii)]